MFRRCPVTLVYHPTPLIIEMPTGKPTMLRKVHKDAHEKAPYAVGWAGVKGTMPTNAERLLRDAFACEGIACADIFVNYDIQIAGAETVPIDQGSAAKLAKRFDSSWRIDKITAFIYPA